MTSREAFLSLRQEYYLENGEHIIVFKDDDERLNIIEKDLEVLEEIKTNHPDLYNLYKKMKEAESECLDGK